MKEFCFILLLSLLSQLSPAQCRIAGNINVQSESSVELVLLYGDGYYETPSVQIPVIAGKFEQQIEIHHPVFAILKTRNWQRRLLLSPNRNLIIKSDKEDSVSFSGIAGEENKLINNSILDSVPFFMKEVFSDNPYARISTAQWDPVIIHPVEAELKKADIKIRQAKMPDSLKRLLINEMRYAWQCQLYQLTSNNMRWANNPDRDILLERAIKFAPFPDSITLTSGLYANMILSFHVQHQINTAIRHAQRNKASIPETIGQLFNQPFAKVDSLCKLYGERYMISLLYARAHLNPSIQEKLLLNKILDACDNADFSTCFYLLDTMDFYFPQSSSLEVAKREAYKIRQRLDSSNTNAAIQFHLSDTIKSLADLIKPYAGKIVYLDVWGTWCGPCKIEMKYVKELKNRFKDKDIVFVYLDMDEDAKDSMWKEYVKYYGIEGQHYRMTHEQIQPIWKELNAAGRKDQLYPSFAIFDRTGKIITAEAARPSEMELLYSQLEMLF